MGTPDWVSKRLDLELLDLDPSQVAVVDRDGKIVWTNAAWRRFALENGAEPGTTDEGQNYFAVMTGPLREPLMAFVDRSRTGGGPVECEYECSSPERERFFRMRIVPLGEDGLVIAHHLTREAPHPGVVFPPSAEHVDASGLIMMCMMCRRTARADRSAWDWIPSWVAHRPTQDVSHGLCPLCASSFVMQ